MYNYYELIKVVESVGDKLDVLCTFLQSNLTSLLYAVVLYILLKVGFSCLRGYKL